MSRNAEVQRILQSREIAAAQRQAQREAQRAAAAKRGVPHTLEHGFVRNSSFPKRLFG